MIKTQNIADISANVLIITDPPPNLMSHTDHVISRRELIHLQDLQEDPKRNAVALDSNPEGQITTPLLGQMIPAAPLLLTLLVCK